MDKPKPQKQELFHFDPNNAPAKDLLMLGFSQNLATRITRYREKGGKFKTKSDLLKIYGVDSTFYQRLYPFISLPEREANKRKEDKEIRAESFDGQEIPGEIRPKQCRYIAAKKNLWYW